MRRTPLLALALSLAAWLPAPIAGAGKYANRRLGRGDVTDVAPKLDAWAFINDEAPRPRRMLMVVDTWTAHGASAPELLPLVVAVAYEGSGRPVAVRSDRFRLTWEDRGETRATNQALVLNAAGGERALRDDGRRLARRGPLPFSPLGQRMAVRFHRPPGDFESLQKDARLTPGTWFTALLYFPLPQGLDRWATRFELTFAGDADLPLASVAFRLERDPDAQQDTFRRARREIQRENRGVGPRVDEP